MAYKVIRSVEVDRDLEMIFRHLVKSYIALGEPLPDAFHRAEQRLGGAKADMRALGRMPHQGIQLFDLGPGLRQVTKNRAIFYFTVDDDSHLVRVISIFFSGQDHQRHILLRLRGI